MDYGRTTQVKIMITTGRDRGSAKWIIFVLLCEMTFNKQKALEKPKLDSVMWLKRDIQSLKITKVKNCW